MNSDQFQCESCSKEFKVKVLQYNLPYQYQKCLECFKKTAKYGNESVLCFQNDGNIKFHSLDSNLDNVPPELANDCNLLESQLMDLIKRCSEKFKIIEKLRNGSINETDEIKKNLKRINSFLSHPYYNPIELEFPNIVYNANKNIFEESAILKNHPNQNFLLDCFEKRKISNLKLYFRGSEHNFQSKLFHEFCDNRGATITVVKSKETKLVFGGYNPRSWSSNDFGYKEASDAFLFQLDYKTKHIVYDNFEKAIASHECYGPIFGGDDLSIGNSWADGSTEGNSSIGSSYSLPNGMIANSKESKNYLAGTQYFTVEEYEVLGIEWV